jgi:diguanylate cyclase (GGDEF)-like protein
VKILIADDDAVTRLWLESILQGWGYQTVTANSGAAAWELLQEQGAPDLVLLDWLMPDMDGIEVCRRLKADADKRFSYVIMLTSRSSTDDIVEALDAGADDLIGKPFEPAELQVRLRVGKRILHLQRELQLKASHDDLTGLLNRRLLMEMALREFESARRGELSISLLLLDIDLFKQINDHLGHQSGDDVLCEVGRRIQETVRLGDIAGRYGGEEFMIILPKCGLTAATEIAQRLRAVLAQPIVANAQELKITASVGIAALTQETLDLADWIARADRALYRAKARGRDRFEIAAEQP